MPPRTAWHLLALCLAPAIVQAAGSVPDRIRIEPPETVLDGRRATAQLIATGHYPGPTVRDLTHEGDWTSSDPSVVAVGPGGRIEPRGDGKAEVNLRLGSSEARAVIRVRNAGKAHPIQFAHEVLPALTKAGCSMGACHGTPTGKNGFRLSLRGFDPSARFPDPRARGRHPTHQPVRAGIEPDPAQGDRPGPSRGRQAVGARQPLLPRPSRLGGRGSSGPTRTTRPSWSAWSSRPRGASWTTRHANSSSSSGRSSPTARPAT